MGSKRARHAVSDTTYHLAWCQKYPETRFEQHKIREPAKHLLRKICEEFGIAINETEVAKDHVNAVISFPKQLSIGDVMRIIKSVNARALFSKFPRIKKRL